MNRRETKVGLLACIAFVIAFPATIAGGLMIAPMVAFLAVVFLPLQPISWKSVRWAWPLIPAAFFLCWTCLSFLWSPYDDAEQIPKTLLGVPLYALFAWRVGALEGPWRHRAEACLIFFVVAAGSLFAYESLTDGHGTMSFKIGAEGYDPQYHGLLQEQVFRSLGHGVGSMLLVAGPAIVLIWQRGFKRLSLVVAALVTLAAFSFGMSVNAAALVLATLVALVASWKPRIALSVVFTGMAGCLVIMPMVLPALISVLPADLTEGLPLSWTLRLEIWGYTSELIAANPWIGYGLEASRTLGDEIVVQGYQGSSLPLHPHNAALHVWLETGLVGILLLAASLVATGEMLSRLNTLSRVQILSLVWVAIAYASLLIFSYGVWQEWHQASLALAVTVIRFLDGEKIG